MIDLLSLSGIYRIEDDPGIPGAENFTWPFDYRVEVTRDENLYNIANDVTSGGQYMENFIQIRDNKDGTYNLTYDEYGDGNLQSFDNIDEDVLMQHLDHLVKMDVATKIDELTAEEMTESESLKESVIFNKKDLDSLEKELRDKLHQVMVSPTLGFYEDEVDEYSGIQITEEDGYIKITAYAEVGFDALWTIMDSLNKVLKRYDSDAYFDMEDAGRLVAYIGTSKLKESVDKSSTRENARNSSVYHKTLSKLSSLGVATSKIYDQPNVGLLFDIEPTDSAINKVVSKLESLGFREVDHYEDDSYRNDSYIVFINEIQGERVVCGIVYNARSNFAFVTAGYDEVEDSEYFEANEVTSKSLKESSEPFNQYLYCQASIKDDVRDYLTDDELSEISSYIGSDGTIINCESDRCDIKFSDGFIAHQIPVEYLNIEMDESLTEDVEVIYQKGNKKKLLKMVTAMQ